MKMWRSIISSLFIDMASQDFENEILKLDIKKAALEDDIPTKMLIISNDIVSNHLTKFIILLRMSSITQHL